jgi:hypothetical protein
VTLVAEYYFAPIIAAWATGFGGFDALAIDHGGGGAFFLASTLPILHHQAVDNRLPHRGIARCHEPAMRGLP